MTGGCWWSRDIAAAQSAHQKQFHSFLPNGKNGLLWLLKGIAALVESINEQINEELNLFESWLVTKPPGASAIHEKQSLPSLLNCGLMAGPPANAPQWKENEKRRDWLNEWSWRNQLLNAVVLGGSFLQLNEVRLKKESEESNTSGAPTAGRQVHSFLQLLLARCAPSKRWVELNGFAFSSCLVPPQLMKTFFN